MYAHHVSEKCAILIDYLTVKSVEKYGNTSREDNPWYNYLVQLNQSVKYIPKARKYHAESFKTLVNFFGKNKEPLFMNSFSSRLRLPYDVCWFDYVNDYNKMDVLPSQIAVSKRGLLVRRMSHDMFWLIIFNYIEEDKMPPDAWGVPVLTGWTLGTAAYVVSVDRPMLGRSEKEMTELNEKFPSWVKNLRKYDADPENKNVIALPLYKKAYDFDKVVQEDATDLNFLQCYLRLLHCKNIVSVPVKPSSKINKKRKAKNKLPLFRYHVLKVQDYKIKRNGTKKSQGYKGLMAVHSCQGHFKTYTKEKPLFGKIVGDIWFSDHVRGEKKRGKIVKDYTY